jgi:hypothetical protein
MDAYWKHYVPVTGLPYLVPILRRRYRQFAAYLGDAKEVVLATYAHFMPDDDDRAREIMNAFPAPTREGADRASCALIVPGDHRE